MDFVCLRNGSLNLLVDVKKGGKNKHILFSNILENVAKICQSMKSDKYAAAYIVEANKITRIVIYY